jgi:thioredoxin 1
MTASTRDLTTANFVETIEGNDLVFVDFWAEWCGPCRAFAPVFEDAAARHGDAVFGKVDTEAQRELAATFDIMSIPTLMVFREQILVFAQPGALPASSFEDLVTQVKALDMDDVRTKMAEQREAPTTS